MNALCPGFRRVWRREWQAVWSSPWRLAMMLWLPLLGMVLLAALFVQPTLRELPIAVVDRDYSTLSRQLIRTVDATPGLRVHRRLTVVAEGWEAVRRGTVHAVVVVPEKFERNVLARREPVVIAYVNTQLYAVSGIVQRDLRASVGTFSAGIEIRQRLLAGEGAAGAGERREPVRTDRVALFNPQMNYAYYLAAGLLPALLHLFAVTVGADAVGRELRAGTAGEWWQSAGGGMVPAVAGKLLVCLVFLAAGSAVMLGLLQGWAGVPWRGSGVLLVLGAVLLPAAGLAVGAALAAVAANLRVATAAAAFYAGPALAFSGLSFPVEYMPLPARAWAALLPLTHYLRLASEQTLRGAPARESLGEVLVLAGFVLVAGLLAGVRLRRVAADPQYWGRR